MATATPKPTTELEALMHKPLAEIAQAQYLPLLGLDLTVTAEPEQMPKESVTFTLRLSPGLLDTIRPARTISTPVLMLDLSGNMTGKSYVLSSKGQTITDTVDVPTTNPCFSGWPDAGREILVIVDPFNTIAERNEGNNFVKAHCYTLG